MVISNDASIILGTFASKSEVWSDKTQTGLCVHCVHALRLLEYQHRESCDAVEPQSPCHGPIPICLCSPTYIRIFHLGNTTSPRSFTDHHCAILHEHRHGCHSLCNDSKLQISLPYRLHSAHHLFPERGCPHVDDV